MENLSTKTTVSFVPEFIYDESDFYRLALDEKVDELSQKLQVEPQPIGEVIDWTVSHIGQKDTLDYLYESPFTPDEITQSLATIKTKEDRRRWQETMEQYVEQPPLLQTRFEQLVYLKDREERLRQTYPEPAYDLRMISVPYKDLYGNLMPSFSPNDTVPSRLSQPTNELAKIYGGEVVVDADLLRAIRGKITPNITGIQFLHTPYGSLARKSSLLANYGLMLVGKELRTREQLREIREVTGVDTLGAGLAEGVAIARFGGLRIGDIAGFPQYIPNSEGDYYCGVNVERLYGNNPYAHNPRLYFGLWRSEGAQNCLLAITAKVS